MSSDNQQHLRRKLALEAVISKIAKEFVHLDGIDDSISRALESLGTFSHSDRAYIFLFQKNGAFMDNVYEWCAEGVEPAISSLQNLEISIFPWWIKQISQGDPLNIHDVESLPAEASAEKDILSMQGIRSVLVLPIMSKNSLNGFVGFDNTHSVSNWSDDDTSVLAIASELFSSAFDRSDAEKQLESANLELKLTIDSLKSAQSQLLQQEQMVAIGQLAAGIAHEINNPLGFIISNQNTLKDYIRTLLTTMPGACAEASAIVDEDAKSRVDFIRDDLPVVLDDMDIGLQRIRKIVDSLRFFSRIDSLTDYELYDLREGIQNTLVVINSRFKDSIAVTIDFDESFPLIEVNGGKINQVILNLVVNAMDAIEDRHATGGALAITARNQDTHVALTFIDNGNGIPEDVLPHIFVPFYTTKPVGKGTGLGLSIAYDTIVNEHHGNISVESIAGTGTTITLTLPKSRQYDHLSDPCSDAILN